ncbi:MGMT family protein [Nocardioides sambongensis]|uniref:MGMT family protein n=1 Tax=Nocardioides sambongensis TaxID=2589074 RepID=UPI00112A9B26|nr:MGMT family protein [Nocardioides sambongensis]
MPSARDPEYVERILDLVEQVPPGRVTTYGALADVAGGGPRQVGTVMAHHGGAVPWWRVIRADGTLPPSHQRHARRHYDAERTPILPSGKVDVRSAFWSPG